MRFDIVTIFPGFFGQAESDRAPAGILGHGVLGRALAAGLVQVKVHNLRDHAQDRHRTVDDRPFGGGEGMVLKPEPIAAAVETLGVTGKATRDTALETVILLSAGGTPFTQKTAQTLAACERIVLICGRYEGVDERIATHIADRELSIGDYVLSGGELGAAVILDAVARLVPGVLGNAASTRFESFGAADALLSEPDEPGKPPAATHGAGGLLDYPHYTRPAEFRGLSVPQVLTNGNHDQVRSWRREQALERTWRNRADLIEAARAAGLLDAADEAYLARLGAGLPSAKG